MPDHNDEISVHAQTVSQVRAETARTSAPTAGECGRPCTVTK
jgi:hypothetical protein